jgi:hypothetical protein
MNRKGFIKKLTFGRGLLLAPFIRTESKVSRSPIMYRPSFTCPSDTAIHHDLGNNLDLISVIRNRFEPLGMPCILGVPTGHVSNILTLPLGVEVEMDADRWSLRSTESTVV